MTDQGGIRGPRSGQLVSALAALMNGFCARVVKRDEEFAVCDIGCGEGTAALMTAAANPAWRVVGLDGDPGRIAAARELARAAGLENVRFVEADLEEFAGDEAARGLEAFDFISAHGVWTRVAEDAQAGIVRLLERKLKPGGVFEVSYNLLTGWQEALGLQRLVREAGLRLAHRAERRVEAGLRIARELAAGFSGGFSGEAAKTLLERMAAEPGGDLARDMMDPHWRPVMHGDVAARLAGAKLAFCGSGQLLDNFPQMMLGEAQRAVMERFDDDPVMVELFKDFCCPRPLRRDVFLRGARRIEKPARDAVLLDVTLGLTAGAEGWRFAFETAAGQAQMAEGYYRRIFERLLEGPARVGELLALPGLAGRRDNPAELIAVSVGTEQVVAMPNPGVAIDARCAKLNLALLRAQFAAGAGTGPMSFALPSLGGGLTLPNFHGMVVHELAADPENGDPAEMAARLAIHQPAELRAVLTEKLTMFFKNDVRILRHFGFNL